VKASADVILVWEAGFGVRQGTAGGSTWNLRWGSSSGDDSYWRGSIAVAPSNAARVYACQSNSAGVWQALISSNDYGTSWTSVGTTGSSLNGRLNAVLFSNALFSFDTTADGDSQCCDCNGDTIQSSDQGWYDNVMTVHPTLENTIFVGGIDLWRSVDGGVSFEQLSNWWIRDEDPSSTKYLHADQHSIVFSPNFASDSTIYFGNDGGISKSTNTDAAGSTNPCAYPVLSDLVFTQLNNGYGTLQFYHGSVSKDGTVFVGGCQDNGSWKFSSGTEWITINGGDGGYTAVDQHDNTYFYSSTPETNIYRATFSDPTNSDQILANNLAGGTGMFINPFVMDAVSDKILYTATDYLYMTNDATVSPGSDVEWNNLGSIANNAQISAMAITPGSEMLYLGSATGIFYVANLKSNSGPTSLGSVCSECSQFYISSIVIDPKDPLKTVYVTTSSFGSPKLWISNNAGSTWTNMDNNLLPDVPVLYLYVDDQSKLLILGTDLGILISEDAGQSWQSDVEGYGIPNTPVIWFSFQKETRKLLAFTHGRGVYSVRVPGTAVGSASTMIWSPMLLIMILSMLIFVQ